MTDDERGHLNMALTYLRNAGCKIDSTDELERFRTTELYEEELTVAAEVRAYFQVAYKV